MSNRYLILVFLIFPLFALAKEKVRIEHIEDANEFVTSDGDKIRLADIKTFSIHETDSLKRQFALRIKKRAETEFLNSDRLYVEHIQGDSTAVYLWKKHVILKEFFNREWLQDGLGFYEPAHNSAYRIRLQRASDIARTRHEGVYNRATYRERYPQTSSAVWVSVGIGPGGLAESSFAHGAALATVRRHFTAWSAGYVVSGKEDYSLNSFLLTGGFSRYGRFAEATLQVGLSHNTGISRYRTFTRESNYEILERVTKKHEPFVAIAIIGQVMLHAPQVLGIGVTAVLNYYPSFSTDYFPGGIAAGIGLSVHMGWWNF